MIREVRSENLEKWILGVAAVGPELIGWCLPFAKKRKQFEMKSGWSGVLDSEPHVDLCSFYF